ncbi:HAD family hydrolase [Motiliproteus sp.]|uniref:HAD family hydrolase n=1 Tax=Motiliproteus sp. TaxID=1898955 RepID=UPI003BA8B175
MPLAIFDLDETLVSGDCSSRFCEYLQRTGLVEGNDFIQRERELMDDYHHQRLSMADYIEFLLAPLAGLSVTQVDALMPAFVERWIRPRIYPQALSTLMEHRRAGDRILIISASAEFIVRAVAQDLGVDDVLAIDLEQTDQQRYDGRIRGIPSYREGKVQRLQQWISQQGESLAGATFYSDSINDRPLMELVDHPVATNPDPLLAELACQRGWAVLDWTQLQQPKQASAVVPQLSTYTGT